MRIALKCIGFAAAALVLIAVITGIAVYRLVRVGEVEKFLTARIEEQTALQLRIGTSELEFGWITGVAFSDVVLTEPGSTKPFLTSRRLTARIALAPLLRRRLIFYEILVAQPVVHLVRDSDGRVPLLDRLLNLPFFEEQEGEFSADLRSIRVQGGEIALIDHRGGKPQSWSAADVGIELERLSGARLTATLRKLLKGEGAREETAALAFDIKGNLAREKATMGFKAHGQLAFPEGELALQQAYWNADIELMNLPAAVLREYAGQRLPVKSMSGYVAHRVHIEGNAASLLQANGHFEFRQLSIDAPELLLAPLASVDARVNFALERRGPNVVLRRGEVRVKDIFLSLQGVIAGLDSDDPRLRLTLSSSAAPAAALIRYLPLKLFGSAQLELGLAAIQAGTLELKKGSVQSSLSELRNPAMAMKLVSGELEVRNLSIQNSGSLLPLNVAQGRMDLADGVLRLRDFRGAYGESRFSRAQVLYDIAGRAPGRLQLEAQGDVSLAEVNEQSRLYSATQGVAEVLAPLDDLSGRAKVDLAMRQEPGAALQFDGKVRVEQARLRYGDLGLTEAHGDFSVTPDEIIGERIAAQLAGSPIQVQLALKDYTATSGTFDLHIDTPGMKAAVLGRVLLKTGSAQDPGWVRGAVRYFGSLHDPKRRSLTGELDLANVQLLFSPLLQPLRELHGRIRIDENGIDFQNLKALLVGFPARASGRWRYEGAPQLTFEFAAPDLDITHLISQIDPESSPFYADLIAEGTLALAKGRIKNFEFADLRAGVALTRRVWRLSDLGARSAGGSIRGVATIFDKPDTLGIVAEPRVEGVPVQSFLRWFDATTTDMTGAVSLSGNLETVGKSDLEQKRNLNGAFHLSIRDGTIRRMRILVQILNLLDLSRWFTLQLPDLTKEGIRFQAITGDFKVVHGVYSTDNLLVDSNDLRMSGAGKIDVAKDEVDFRIAVRPFAGIDTALNYIPFIGRGVAAIKNSFLVASFTIQGPIDNPTITPAPLGTMSEWFWGVLGIPKNMIGVGEGADREQPGSKPAAK